MWCAPHRCASVMWDRRFRLSIAVDVGALQYLRQFRSKSALRFVIALLSTAASITPVTLLIRSCPRSRRCGRRRRASRTTLGRHTFRGLRGVGPQDLVLERCSVETPDNRRHLVRGGCLHESEAFRLLRFVIPDDLNRIRDKVLGGEPLFNVVRCDPSG